MKGHQVNDRNEDNLIKYGFIVEVPMGEHLPVEECVKRLEDAVGHPVNDGKLSVRVLTNDLFRTTLYEIKYVDNSNQTEDPCDQ